MPLDDIALFAGVSAGGKARLMAHAVRHAVKPGTVLFDQGDIPTFQLVLMAGTVHLYGHSGGKDVLIEAITPPDLVIPAAVVTEAPYLVQARAVELSQVLMIEARIFRQVLAEEPALAQAMVGCLASQFRRLVRQVKNLKLRSAVQRVGCHILALAAQQGTPDRVVLPYEKNIVASQLGITRESFSRALATLQDAGIAVEGEIIHIRDAALLAGTCQPDPLIDGAESGAGAISPTG